MKKEDRGFIGLLVLIIIALALAKYFLDFDLFEAADSNQGRETVGYTGQVLRLIWTYIGEPVSFVWNRIVAPLAVLWWQTFKAFIVFGQGNISALGQ